MKQRDRILHFIQLFFMAFLATAISLIFMENSPKAHALPEYANRTGESCATCHVDPGGGGPRTLRGMLWAAQGRPEKVPELQGILLAPGVEDGRELYEIACASCHGLKGEGLFGRKLARTGLRANKILTNILKGRISSGMPSFESLFTEAQLRALVDYVVSLANGEVEPLPQKFPLPRAEFDCAPQILDSTCGGN